MISVIDGSLYNRMRILHLKVKVLANDVNALQILGTKPCCRDASGGTDFDLELM
jgi:hypothetical protein